MQDGTGKESSITLKALASPTHHWYNGLTIRITRGKGYGQTRKIFEYDGGTCFFTHTHTHTLSRALLRLHDVCIRCTRTCAVFLLCAVTLRQAMLPGPALHMHVFAYACACKREFRGLRCAFAC